MTRAFEVGDRLHGFCNGYFGRDSYACRTVEVVRHDFIVTRCDEGYLELAAGFDTLRTLIKHRDDPDFSYCSCNEAGSSQNYWEISND